MQEEDIRQNIYIYNICNKMVRWQWCKKERKKHKVRDGEVNGIEEIHITVRSRRSLQVWFFDYPDYRFYFTTNDQLGRP